MADLRELYQEAILDHSRSPRNNKRLDPPHRSIEGYNPLCGDQLTVYVRTAADRIEEVSFEGSGCAISRASASMMTTAVAGKTVQEAESLFSKFQAMATGQGSAESLGKLAVFSGVRDHPSRVKCAMLAWHALRAALKGDDSIVSTE